MHLKLYIYLEKSTITEMSEKLMISRKHLSNIISGRVKPSKRLARDIEVMTNGKVTAAELLSIQMSKDSQKD